MKRRKRTNKKKALKKILSQRKTDDYNILNEANVCF